MRFTLAILCFIIVLHDAWCFPNLWRRITGRGIGEGQSQEQINDHDISKTTTDHREVQIPEKLFSTSLVSRQNSFCQQARMEFEKLCDLRSAFERVKLASLVTSCHLEVSGRPGFEWDPVKKLGDADSDYVHLVMQFLPLMNDVCQKAGFNPFLAQLVADTKSTDDISSSIIELQEATERLFQANRESSEFVKDYMTASADASKKLTEILKLSAAIKDANDAIDSQRKSLHQEADNIKNELQEFTKNSLSSFDSMFGRFDGFQSQMRNMANTVGQIQSDSRVTSMFLQEPLKVISNTSMGGFSDANLMRNSSSSPFLSFRKLGFLKTIILGPLKLSERIHQLENNSFLGPFVKDIFSSIQLLLVLLSMYIAYIALTAFTRVVEAFLHFAAILIPSQPMLVRLNRLVRKRDQPQTRFQSLDMEQELAERMSANISKAFSSASVAEKFANIVRNESTYKRMNLLLTRVSEIEMQVSKVSQDFHLLHHAIQSINREDCEEKGPCTCAATSALKCGRALEARATSVPLLTSKEDDNCDSGSKHQDAAEPSEVIISTAKDCLRDEQLECSDDLTFRAIDRRESDTRDQSSRRSSEKTGSKTPRRELRRRRSSRRKV